MDKMIKVGDGYVRLRDYMVELREHINMVRAINKTYLDLDKDFQIEVEYKRAVYAVINYEDNRIKVTLSWYDNAVRPWELTYGELHDEKTELYTIYSPQETATNIMDGIRAYAQRL